MEALRFLALAAVLFFNGPDSRSQAQERSHYLGPCDASAAAAIDNDHFVVANDETDTLHIYRRGTASAVASLSLSAFLGTPAGREADIEGAAAIGNRIYWITSHGRDRRGADQESRRRIFATEIRAGDPPAVEAVGEPYTRLLQDLEASEALRPYQLGRAARLPPEADGGLNIEGLAATPSGHLLIGFRNPLRGGRALIVPLENPAEVIEGTRARLGAPIELDLGGRGIRSFELIDSSYLIAAGPTGDTGSFALYRWSGSPADAAMQLATVDLRQLRPEALFAIPQSAHVQVLSDDGGVTIDGVECKALPQSRQTFGSLIIPR